MAILIGGVMRSYVFFFPLDKAMPFYPKMSVRYNSVPVTQDTHHDTITCK